MNMPLTDLRLDAIAAQLALGLAGGLAAWWLGVPMPFLVGGLLATAAAAIRSGGAGVFGYRFPQPVRRYFTAIIGVMIGQSFSPELLQGLVTYKITIAGVLLFVAIAQGTGYLVFRMAGGYDRATAYFAGMPGGLIEAITFAEKHGADVQAITVQHFVRVILVVLIVPFGFLIWTGVSVGSAAGLSFETASRQFSDFAWTVTLAAGGIVLGRGLHLPAAVLVGPLLLSAGLQGMGAVDAAGPTWLLYAAQLVVGVGLGSSFSGISRALLVRAFLLCGLSVAIFLAIGIGFALILHRLTGLDLPALIVSFMPGGVTEMSLIALSLDLSPLIVATHHVARILLTVALASFVVKLGGRRS